MRPGTENQEGAGLPTPPVNKPSSGNLIGNDGDYSPPVSDSASDNGTQRKAKPRNQPNSFEAYLRDWKRRASEPDELIYKLATGNYKTIAILVSDSRLYRAAIKRLNSNLTVYLEKIKLSRQFKSLEDRNSQQASREHHLEMIDKTIVSNEKHIKNLMREEFELEKTKLKRGAKDQVYHLEKNIEETKQGIHETDVEVRVLKETTARHEVKIKAMGRRVKKESLSVDDEWQHYKAELQRKDVLSNEVEVLSRKYNESKKEVEAILKDIQGKEKKLQEFPVEDSINQEYIKQKEEFAGGKRELMFSENNLRAEWHPKSQVLQQLTEANEQLCEQLTMVEKTNRELLIACYNSLKLIKRSNKLCIEQSLSRIDDQINKANEKSLSLFLPLKDLTEEDDEMSAISPFSVASPISQKENKEDLPSSPLISPEKLTKEVQTEFNPIIDDEQPAPRVDDAAQLTNNQIEPLLSSRYSSKSKGHRDKDSIKSKSIVTRKKPLNPGTQIRAAQTYMNQKQKK